MRKRLLVLAAHVAAVVAASSIALAQDPELLPLPPPGPVTAAPGDVSPARVEPPPPSPVSVPIPSVWYGDQTLAVDLGTLALLAVGGAVAGATKDDSFGGVVAAAGVVGYWLGGPLVHAAHGRGMVATQDFLLRFFLPGIGAIAGVIVGSVVGAQYSCGTGDGGPFNCGTIWGLIAGDFGGFAAAIALDAAVLAREPAKAPPGPFQLSLAPMFQIVRERERQEAVGAVIGVMGRF
jgi:hypothetical protein